MKRRIFHAFNWNLRDVINNLEWIREQHFTSVLISPVQPHKEGNDWYFLYQPLAFKIVDKELLKELCDKANEVRLEVIADVVCNHVANQGGGELALIPNENIDPVLKNKFFYKDRTNIVDFKDRWQQCHWCIGLPGLNLDNWELQDIIDKFIKELVECGAKGVRIDASKHVGLPEEGYSFFTRILGKYSRMGIFIMHEVLEAEPWLLEKYSKYGYVLTNSVGGDKGKMVKFSESHDTFNNEGPEGYTKFTNENVIVDDYREICRNYPNTLFYPRPFSNAWKSKEVREANCL